MACKPRNVIGAKSTQSVFEISCRKENFFNIDLDARRLPFLGWLDPFFLNFDVVKQYGKKRMILDYIGQMIPEELHRRWLLRFANGKGCTRAREDNCPPKFRHDSPQR